MQNSTLITGLWKHRTKNGREYMIGRIGHNLNAIIIANKKKDGSDKQPDFFLYFSNGKREDIQKQLDSENNL